jgi:hypothetical protein
MLLEVMCPNRLKLEESLMLPVSTSSGWILLLATPGFSSGCPCNQSQKSLSIGNLMRFLNFLIT